MQVDLYEALALLFVCGLGEFGLGWWFAKREAHVDHRKELEERDVVLDRLRGECTWLEHRLELTEGFCPGCKRWLARCDVDPKGLSLECRRRRAIARKRPEASFGERKDA